MADSKSGSYVVGRYAYMIYNEGGLLDVNAAGRPNTLSTAQQALASRKGPEAFADLTQIPDSPVNEIGTFPRKSWIASSRGATTRRSNPPAPFPSYTYTSSNVDSYFQYLLGPSPGSSSRATPRSRETRVIASSRAASR